MEMILAGQKVGEAIRRCKVGENGKKPLRVSVYIRPTGKVIRPFASKKQGLTDKQVDCIQRRLKGIQFRLSRPYKGFIEWSLRILANRTVAIIVGPSELNSRLARE